jgi:predicted O-methyltransferase YrrM
MSSIKNRLIQKLARWISQSFINWRGVTFSPPGHFYSPLMDIESIPEAGVPLSQDGSEAWAHIPLRQAAQCQLYQLLLAQPDLVRFPQHAQPDFRYHWDNGWFPESDALLLSGILQHLKPKRVIEVGSGFSTAVILDTLDRHALQTEVICIEPFPERLQQLLKPADHARISLKREIVQHVPLSVFQDLQAGDILFIDSSHVVKPGSDVSYFFLQVLPILAKGVWVHFHDLFYPESYPHHWLTEGRAWNESLFLRTFLLGNSSYQIEAFNAYAGHTFAKEWQQRWPCFSQEGGSSLWLQKCHE